MRCSCPDYAGMCKHVAAVMYGVGESTRFARPSCYSYSRGVDHKELIEQAIPTAPVKAAGNAPTIAADELGAIFEIEIGDAPGRESENRDPAPEPGIEKSREESFGHEGKESPLNSQEEVGSSRLRETCRG